MNDPTYSDSIAAAQNFFEKAYGTNNYSLTVSHKLNPVVDIGAAQVPNSFTCHTIVPLPVVGLSYECSYVATSSVAIEGLVTFQTPSGEISCIIINTLTSPGEEPGDFGIDLSQECQRLEPKLGVLDEDYNPATTLDTNDLDIHAVDLNISDEIYTLVLLEQKAETDPLNQNNINITLIKDGNAQDCALNLELTIPGTKRFEDVASWCEAQKAEGKQCI